MSTFTAILTPSPDGTLHVPVPEKWRLQDIRVTAELEPVTQPQKPARAKAGLWKDLPGPFYMAPDFDDPLEDFGENL